MGSTVGNDQNTLLYDFYAKIQSKMQEKHATVLETLFE